MEMDWLNLVNLEEPCIKALKSLWSSTVLRLEPLRDGSLLFTTNFPEILGTLFVAPQKHPNKERYFKKEVLQTMLYIDVIISIDITLKLIKCTRHNSEMKSTCRRY